MRFSLAVPLIAAASLTLSACGLTPASLPHLGSTVTVAGGGACPPRITEVSGLDAGVNLPVVIDGSCFGTHAPYTGWSRRLRIRDLTLDWSAGLLSASGHRDAQGLTVTSWTNHQIVLAPPVNLSWNSGDEVRVSIWNTPGAAPAQYTTHIGQALALSLAPSANAGGGAGEGVPWLAVSRTAAAALVSSLRQSLVADGLATRETEVGMAVYPTIPSSARAIREMGTVFDVVSTAPQLVEGLYDLGASGVLLGGLGQLTTHTLPTAGAFGALGSIAAETITNFYDSTGQAASQDASLWSRVSCGGPRPEYLVASGQALVLTATNLRQLPTNGVITLTEPLTVGQTYPGNAPACTPAVVGDVLPTNLSGGDPVFWRPHPPGTSAPPTVASVSGLGSGATQTVTITGSGFGTHAPYSGTSNHLRILDVTGPWDAGWNHWDQGASCWSSCSDWVTVQVAAWTNTKIVLTGFAGSLYGSYYSFQPGDTVTFYVWNANQTWSPHWRDGAGSATVTVSHAAPGPTISSISPASGPFGTVFTVTGARLTTVTRVTVGGVAATFHLSGSTLLVTAPVVPAAAQALAAGANYQATVRVVGPCGTQSCSAQLPLAFTYVGTGG